MGGLLLKYNWRAGLVRTSAQALGLVLLFLFASCTPEGRLRRLLKKNPHLVKSDTIFVSDTVITRSYRVDTVFAYYQRDTVIVREGKVTQRYFYNTTDSTVYIDCNCESDTIIREVPVIVNKPTVERQGIPGWQVVGISLVMIILTFLATKLIEIFKKRSQK